MTVVTGTEPGAQQQRPAATIASSRLDLLRQRLFEMPKVEQCGQIVVVDEVLQTPFELFALRDVLKINRQSRIIRIDVGFKPRIGDNH